MTVTSVRLGVYTVNLCLLFLQDHRETDRFCAVSGFLFHQPTTSTITVYHYRHTVFSSQLKGKVGHILPKTVVLHTNLNVDDTPVTSDF
jgi:hypothetical protein